MKIRMMCCAVALGAMTATASLAQTDTMPADANRNSMNATTTTDSAGNTVVTGKVVSTSGDRLVVETENGSRMTFDTTGYTVPNGATVGTRVQIAYAPNQTASISRLSTVTVMSNAASTADNRY